jgi:hypothetical protein
MLPLGYVAEHGRPTVVDDLVGGDVGINGGLVLVVVHEGRFHCFMGKLVLASHLCHIVSERPQLGR